MDGNYIVAVDIGTSQVTMMVARRGKDSLMHVEAEERADVGNNGIRAGQIENGISLREAVSSVKKAFAQRHNINVSSAYVGISGTHVRCVRFETSVPLAGESVTERDLERLNGVISCAKANSDEEIIDRILLYYTVDDGSQTGNPVGVYGKVLHGTYIFVVADSAQILRITQAFRQENITISRFIANPTVTYRAVLTNDDMEEGAMVIDMGKGTTDICVVSRGHIEYFASIPIGGRVIDSDIHAGLGIPLSNITQIRHKYGCALASEVDDNTCFEFNGANKTRRKCLRWNLATVIECRLREIFGMVKDELKESRLTSRVAHSIVLTGGLAYTEEIARLASSILGVEVRIGSVESGFDEESLQYDVPPLASSFGLILEGARYGYSSITEIGYRAPQGAPSPEAPVQPSISIPAAPERDQEPEAGEDDGDGGTAGPSPEPYRRPGWLHRILSGLKASLDGGNPDDEL